MRIIGHFNNINNDKTYWVKIGETGTIKYIQDSLDDLNEQAICWSTTPVTISSDVSDTFENVFIRSCEINLVANFSIKDYVVADNYMDIPVEIRYDDENGEIIFSGCVVPLQYNQPFANEWNEINIECVDKLGILDYIKLRPLLQSTDYCSPREIIDTIIGLENDLSTNNAVKFQAKLYNIDYDHTQDTMINPSIFIGASEDDWMTCKEALEEIGKIYGCYFYQNGDTCVIENIMLYNLNNPVTITENDYSADDTNVTIQEAYNRIECTVDLSTLDETFIDPFKDEFFTPATKVRERVFTELIVKQDDEIDDQIGFAKHCIDAINIPVIDWSKYQYYNSEYELDVYDTYCQVMENNLFDFGTNNYLTSLNGQNKDAWKVLEWLWNHPFHGAFLSLGTTDDIQNPENNKVVETPQMSNCLLIQVNGPRTASDLANPTFFTDQIYNNIPVCSFRIEESNNIVPTDRSTTNYLVISGKITLNPITPRTDYYLYCGITRDQWKDFYDSEEYSYVNPWLAWQISQCPTTGIKDWAQNILVGESLSPFFWDKNQLLFDRVVKKPDDDNDDGVFYQRYTWDNTPEGWDPSTGIMYGTWPYNQTPNFTRYMAVPPMTPKFEKFNYECSSYDRDGDKLPIDGIQKLAVLACELKIGDKYLVENLDMLGLTNQGMNMQQYNQTYKWLTLDECPIKDGQRQTWFTLGFDPSNGKCILGTEWDIQNTASIDKAITEKGLAIPIYSTSGLIGPVEFKILGPYNLYIANQKVKHKFLFWELDAIMDVPLMAYLENIIIKDLKITLCQSNKTAEAENSDNDLVYYSYENKRYHESKDYDCKFCTSLTSDDVERLGIKYEPNNSAIMHINSMTGNLEAWTGMTYKGSTGVKLEEARVEEHYNIWKRPRSIVEISLKLINPESSYIKTNYRFNYLKNSDNTYQIYKILGREIDLKEDTMQCQMKELSD